MKPVDSVLLFCFILLGPLVPASAQGQESKSASDKLIEEGFVNVRTTDTGDYRVYTIQNDAYKTQAMGIARALKLIEESDLPAWDKPIKVIATDFDVPQLTLTYSPQTGEWSTTSRLDESWDAVRHVRKRNSSFGKVDVVVYPQLSLMNLIITQVYQSLWQLSPSVEVSLWPGGKLAYQVRFPIFNDGYGENESMVHPGFVTVSQRFRDPWNLNIFGKLTLGTFNSSRYGAALEMKYIFPNERFSVDTQLGLLALYYWRGFVFHYDRTFDFRWNVAANYYWPKTQTQFTLRWQQFLLGEYGVKFEMMRHFRYCSVGFYAEKALDKMAHTNGGFRFTVELPPYRYRRFKSVPRVTTGTVGMIYNANNEQYYYKEFRAEAGDTPLKSNQFNPFYVNGEIKSQNKL